MSSLLDDAATGAVAPPVRKLYRARDKRMLGGVAAGLCNHLGLRSRKARTLVRLAFLLFAFGSGVGVVLYGAFWIVVPVEPGLGPPRQRPLWQQYAIGIVAAAVALGVAFMTVPRQGYFVPVVLAGLGAALLWRQSSEYQRQRWTQLSAESLRSAARGRAGIIRLCGGAAMVVLGVILVLLRGTSFDQIFSTLFVAFIVVIGIALLTGPVWVAMVSDLSAERRALIRAQERADLAAHVHDSVLQTLALIQRNAGSPREVARLARGQERELRELLYGTRATSGSFAAELRAAVGQVEDDYAITVESVVVGDRHLDADLDAVVQAAREALVNAAKHAAVETVSLYAEVDERQVELFVRDRGSGFDPATIGPDRHGVRGSIEDRIQRHGGTVRVRSAPGEGTEIEIRMDIT